MAEAFQDLLKACRKERKQAQEQLVHNYSGYLFTIIRRFVSDHDSAKDLLQDTFVQVFKNIQKFEGEEHGFMAWSKRIAINLCIRRYQKKQKFQIIDEAPNDNLMGDSDAVANHAIAKLSADELMNLINRLKAAQNTVFKLFAIEGYTHAEIAEMLKIKEVTSRSHLKRARKQLQQWLAELEIHSSRA